MNKAPFRYIISVGAQDIDDLNHVNNVVYLRWVQDAAAAHWNAVAPAQLQTNFAWVVLRHEIDYKRSAVLDDIVVAETWVSSCEGVRSVRHVKMTNLKTGDLLAEAKTTWCLVDAVTKRPRRIEADIISIFL
jgi:acyl-CoA thioester hydrolase